MTIRQHYYSYLLRIWKIADGEETAWRASLEVPSTGERMGFAGLDALFRWLESQVEADASVPGRSIKM